MIKVSKSTLPKVPRSKLEMLERLAAQLSILEEHAKHAFENGKIEYCGEVATKLRLLVVRAGRNVPLLFEVAEQFGVQITIDVPEGPVKRDNDPTGTMPFEQYFDKIGYMYKGTNGPEYVTSKQFIQVMANQYGGAHEDWAVEGWLEPMLHFHKLIVNGLPVAHHELRGLASVTVRFGRGLIEKIRSDLSEDKANPVC